MQVLNPNEIKIYNLSVGKSLPAWISDSKRRKLLRQDVELRKRIELIQDFSMPAVSNCIEISRDGQYIYVSGVYKPRIKCYDTSQLSLKFERGMDSEVVKLHILSDDYSKVVFLQNDRFVEFHAQHGRYYRTRIPRYGRDFSYHYPSCDLYFVGVSSEIYRLNLEQGRFLNSLKTSASSINCCEFNMEHQLFTCGTSEGHVDCWDPRTRNKVATLDCALAGASTDSFDGLPSVTSLKYKNALNLGVGTRTGHILLYDLRSDKPFIVKDQLYGLPIKKIEFFEDYVMSMDKIILKLWNYNTGNAFTSIEPGSSLNDLCLVPKSGMIFMATEAPKVLSYYIPSIGPAPKWCSFLDSLTEELEENTESCVYDDYKFVTRAELESLGLIHLIGSNLLRAYMHGYFMDIRLYTKAKSLAEPFKYDDYRKKKIQEQIENERINRVQLKKLPKVNKELAEKLMHQEEDTNKNKKSKRRQAANLLSDERFSGIFKDPDFQIDRESEEYRLLNPLVNKLDKIKEKQSRLKELEENIAESDSVSGDGLSDYQDSSDDEITWNKELKQQYKESKIQEKELLMNELSTLKSKSNNYEVTKKNFVENKKDIFHKKNKLKKKSFSERLKETKNTVKTFGNTTGNMEIVFQLNKKKEQEKKSEEKKRAHLMERKKLRRSAGVINRVKTKPKFWMGKRVI